MGLNEKICINAEKMDMIFAMVFLYLGAFCEFNKKQLELEQKFEKETKLKFGWSKNENFRTYISSELYEEFRETAKMVLEFDDWNEFGIITPFSLFKLACVFDLDFTKKSKALRVVCFRRKILKFKVAKRSRNLVFEL